MNTKILLYAGLMLLLFNRLYAQNLPVAVNDTAYGTTYEPITINVLQNDYDPDGDSLIIDNVYVPQVIGSSSYYNNSGNAIIQDSNLVVTLDFYATTWVRVRYSVCKKNNPAYNTFGFLWINPTNPGYNFLDINNVKGRFSSTGNHFWDFLGKSQYNIPKNTVKSTLFSAASWLAGKDASGNIHVAAERYRNDGEDYWCGPLSSPAGYDFQYDRKWNKIWKLKKSDIDYHKTHYWMLGYMPVAEILSWPGNGDITLGQSAQLAPYYDNNNNGVYEPMQGDYPLIRGDECLFFINNDDRNIHKESGGRKLGVEVHGMAYAFDCPEDSALNTATFLHYELINRSDTIYDSTYYGLFVDTDLGYAWDDYVRSDVSRGAFYTYNGFPVDGNGDPEEYGAFPPVQAIVALGGPYMDPDGLDNPKVGPNTLPMCDFSINGVNFGDSIIDNERYGMTGFSYFMNCYSGPTCDPSGASDYYKFLRSVWKDDTHMTYGGNGHPSSVGGTSIDCRYMFPDLSDQCNFGTNGVQPAGYQTGAGGTGNTWTDENAGNDPADRRGLLIMGPFTFNPGESQFIDIAFVFARNYTDTSNTAAVPVLIRYIDSIRSYFINDYTPCNGNFTTIQKRKDPANQLVISPNPAKDNINITYSTFNNNNEYAIFDIKGTLIRKGMFSAVKTQMDISGFSNGVYFIKVSDRNTVVQKKFVVVR